MILERGKFVPLQKSLQTQCVATDFASEPILCAWQARYQQERLPMKHQLSLPHGWPLFHFRRHSLPPKLDMQEVRPILSKHSVPNVLLHPVTTSFLNSEHRMVNEEVNNDFNHLLEEDYKQKKLDKKSVEHILASLLYFSQVSWRIMSEVINSTLFLKGLGKKKTQTSASFSFTHDYMEAF